MPVNNRHHMSCIMAMCYSSSQIFISILDSHPVELYMLVLSAQVSLKGIPVPHNQSVVASANTLGVVDFSRVSRVEF